MDVKYGINVDDEIFGYLDTKDKALKYVEQLANKMEEMYKKQKPYKKFYQEGIVHEKSDKIFEINLYGYTPGTMWNGASKIFYSVKCYAVPNLTPIQKVEVSTTDTVIDITGAGTSNEDTVILQTPEQEKEIVEKEFEDGKLTDYTTVKLADLSMNSIGLSLYVNRISKSTDELKKLIEQSLPSSKSIHDLPRKMEEAHKEETESEPVHADEVESSKEDQVADFTCVAPASTPTEPIESPFFTEPIKDTEQSEQQNARRESSEKNERSEHIEKLSNSSSTEYSTESSSEGTESTESSTESDSSSSEETESADVVSADSDDDTIVCN